MKSEQISVILVMLISSIAFCNANGGSKCEGTSCTPAPGGTTCEPVYGRDDGCCPEWKCANGQSIYGMSKGSSSFSSSSSSFGFGQPPSFGGSGGGFPKFPSLNLPFPFFGRR